MSENRRWKRVNVYDLFQACIGVKSTRISTKGIVGRSVDRQKASNGPATLGWAIHNRQSFSQKMGTPIVM